MNTFTLIFHCIHFHSTIFTSYTSSYTSHASIPTLLFYSPAIGVGPELIDSSSSNDNKEQARALIGARKTKGKMKKVERSQEIVRRKAERRKSVKVVRRKGS